MRIVTLACCAALVWCAGVNAARMRSHDAAATANDRPFVAAQVWTSRANCASPHRVRLAITYDEKTVYRGVIALCQVDEAALPSATPRLSKFSFFGAPRDLAPASTQEQRHAIEGRVWEASADADSVKLGLSFTSGGEVLLYTTHAVSPTTPTHDTLATNLVISTEPPAPR